MASALLKKLARAGGCLAVALVVGATGLDAGCNCGGGSGGVVMGPAPAMNMAPLSPPYGAYSAPVSQMPSDLMGGPVMLSDMLSGPPLPTYLRPTRPIPVDKHPRVSIIDVQANGATQVKVYGTNEYRTKDGIAGFQDRRNAALWRFESEPLTPGVPHIYRVDAYFGESVQHRYVRLVPGRIVTLEF